MYIKENTMEKISSAFEVNTIMQAIYAARPKEDSHREYFYSIGLDSQNRVKIVELVSIGSINSCPVHIREITKTALLKDCTSIIICHNHPTGVLNPSTDDTRFTAELKKALKLLNIKLIDSLIISEADGRYFSFQDQGII